jgi:hypothetical protein
MIEERRRFNVREILTALFFLFFALTDRSKRQRWRSDVRRMLIATFTPLFESTNRSQRKQQ